MGLAKFLEHDVGDVIGRVKPHEIQQRQGTHGITASQLHPVVDIFPRREPRFKQPNGVQKIGHEEPVHHKSGRVLADDRRFPDLLHEALGAVERGIGGGERADDLDQLHERHGVEEVEPQDALGMRRGGGDLGDREGGGVAGQHSVRLHHLVEHREDLALRPDVLDHRLHHELAGGQVLELGRALDITQDLVLVRGLDLALGDPVLEKLPYPAQTFVQRRLVDLAHQGLDSRLRAHLRDPRAHESTAHHTDTLERSH